MTPKQIYIYIIIIFILELSFFVVLLTVVHGAHNFSTHIVLATVPIYYYIHIMTSSSSSIIIIHHHHPSSSSIIIIIIHYPQLSSKQAFLILMHTLPNVSCLGEVSVLDRRGKL